MIFVLFLTALTTVAEPANSVNAAQPATAGYPASSSADAVPQVVIQKQADFATQRQEASSKIVVGAEELNRFADTSVSAVLQRQAGVNLVNGQISLRGMAPGYTQILLNGEPAPPGFSLSSISPASLERIEILPGVRADQASQAIAGSINLIFKTNSANLPPVSQLQTSQGRTQENLSLAQDLNYAQAGLNYGLRLQAQRNRYSGLQQSQEQQRETGADRLSLAREILGYDQSQQQRWSLQPRLQAQLTPGESWQAQVTLEHSQTQARGDSHEYTGIGESNQFPENSYQSQTWQIQGRAEVLWKRRLNADLRMQNKLSFWYSDRDIDYRFTGLPDVATQKFERQVVSNANEKKWLQSSQFNWNLNQQHSLGFGWSLAQTQRSEQRLQHDRWLALTAGAKLAADDLNEAYQARIRHLAGFLQDEWDINQAWRSYLGLRWESLSNTVQSSASSLQQEGLVKTHAAVWSPVLNLLWRDPELQDKKLTRQWRFALGRSYKAPEPRQIIPRRYTVNNGNNPANADFAGNPDLLPELAWNADLAYEYSWGEGTWLGLSGYYKRIQNVVIEDLINYQQRWLIHPHNLASASVRGLEFDLRMPLRSPQSLAQILKGSWSMRMHAALHQSNLPLAMRLNSRLPGQLPYSWNFALDYQQGAQQASLNWLVQGGGWSHANAWVSNYQAQTNKLEFAWHYRYSKQLKLSFAHNQSVRDQARQLSVYQSPANQLLRVGITPAERESRLQLEFSY